MLSLLSSRVIGNVLKIGRLARPRVEPVEPLPLTTITCVIVLADMDHEPARPSLLRRELVVDECFGLRIVPVQILVAAYPTNPGAILNNA